MPMSVISVFRMKRKKHEMPKLIELPDFSCTDLHNSNFMDAQIQRILVKSLLFDNLWFNIHVEHVINIATKKYYSPTDF